MKSMSTWLKSIYFLTWGSLCLMLAGFGWAIREMVKNNPYPDLFRGCTSPEQGLDVSVFKELESGLYFVVISQHFSRCGGPRVRVLDAWYEYAVTAQGEVLGEAPPLTGEAPLLSPLDPPSEGPAPDAKEDGPAPAPAPVIETSTRPEASTEGAITPLAPPLQEDSSNRPAPDSVKH